MFKLLGWIFGGKSPLTALTDTYIKYKDSAIESERIKADIAKKRIDVELDAQRSAREVRLATAGYWEMRLLTFAIALPFVSHLWLVFLDTIFRFKSDVDAFPDPFNEWEGAILLSFFGIYTIGKGISQIAGAIASRRKQNV